MLHALDVYCADMAVECVSLQILLNVSSPYTPDDPLLPPCSHKRCQLKQLAARGPHYFILLERHTLPPPFCLRCTLAMIHTVLSEAIFFFAHPLSFLSMAPLGELLDSLRLFPRLVKMYDVMMSGATHVSHLNATAVRVFLSEGMAGGEGYGQSRGTALSLLSPRQRCSRLTTCPLRLHTQAHAHTHIALSIKNSQKTSPAK